MDQKIAVSKIIDLEQPDLYLNRELSLIEFNRRVFEESKDSRHPLLERVKFLSIFETNTDEFMMIRLAGLKDQLDSRNALISPDGLNAREQLRAVRKALSPLLQEVRDYWRDTLCPLLQDARIYIRDYEELDEQQREAIRGYFEREIFPVLTPLAVDTAHPFPHISNRSLNLAVVVTDISHNELFARLKVPPALPRLVPVPLTEDVDETEPQPAVFVWIEQVIAANLHLLFPGFEIWEAYPFRVLRDADIELQEDEADDLLKYIEQEVRERRFGAVVNLAIYPSMPPRIRSLLIDNLEITSADITVIDGPLGMGDVMELTKLKRLDLLDKPFTPRIPAILSKSENVFSAIQRHDILLHHPYDSFSSVIDFIRAAADDPQVLAIKQTLYRVGQNAPIVKALLQAYENGKEVAVLVELKARFDEENNIVWARELEQAGVHVAYGLVGLKTHAKVAMVIRKEENGLHRYLHLGTGNYNATTARIYEDLCLLTHEHNLATDSTALFNSLTGYAKINNYRKLLVAPQALRDSVCERIEREIRVQEKHGNGRLIFKMNALADPDVVRYLYRASQAEVQIDLLVRGVCVLRPGVPGLSETIRVRSIVGRFLEHSRVYYFGNDGEEEMYLGSADMMQRNLNTRVEVLFPIESRKIRASILENMLKPLLRDTANAHQLQADGSYMRVRPAEGDEPFDSQNWFISHPLFDIDIEDNTVDPTMGVIPSGA